MVNEDSRKRNSARIRFHLLSSSSYVPVQTTVADPQLRSLPSQALAPESTSNNEPLTPQYAGLGTRVAAANAQGFTLIMMYLVRLMITSLIKVNILKN